MSFGSSLEKRLIYGSIMNVSVLQSSEKEL